MLDRLLTELHGDPLERPIHNKIWYTLAAGLPDFSALESLEQAYETWACAHNAPVKNIADARTFLAEYDSKVLSIRSTYGVTTPLDLALALGRRYSSLRENLYQQLKFVDALFRRHEIEYWIVSGTLIAAERHQRLIPWDTDIDLEISEKDVPRLKQLTGELEQAGMGVRLAFPQHYKLAPCFDVFVWNNRAATSKGAELFPTREETLPLTTYKIRDLTLPGPGHVNRYLSRAYGIDWRERGQVWNDRFNSYWGKSHEPLRYLVDIATLHQALGWELDPLYIHPVDTPGTNG